MIELKGTQCLLKEGFNSGAVGYLKCNSQIVQINGNYISRMFFLMERTKQYDSKIYGKYYGKYRCLTVQNCF